MENRRILKALPRGVKRGFVIGSVAAALATSAVQILAVLVAHLGEHILSFLVGGAWMVAIFPISVTSRALGLRWDFGRPNMSVAAFSCMMIMNSLLAGLLGAALGYALHLRGAKTHDPTDRGLK